MRAAIARAAEGRPTAVEVPGLSSMGDRQSWYGTAEIRGHALTRSSMAHATALGKLIANSGLCAPWPDSTFRVTIDSNGDMVTVSAAAEGSVRPPGRGPVRDTQGGAPGAGGRDLRGGEPVPGKTPSGSNPACVPDDAAVERFYLALGELAAICHGPRCLRDCHGTDGWPRHGVYFFHEPGEVRTNGDDRVVRVGTHALTAISQTTLWGRLRQHRGHLAGHRAGGGNHRASVFRRHVGAALIRRENLPRELLDSWLDRKGPQPGWAAQEHQIEQAVSLHIGAMPFLWLAVPGRADRDRVERNSIALTSRLAHGSDRPSADWLGRDAGRIEIRTSGLWNVDHVRHRHDPQFLDLFEQLIQRQRQPTARPDGAMWVRTCCLTDEVSKERHSGWRVSGLVRPLWASCTIRSAVGPGSATSEQNTFARLQLVVRRRFALRAVMPGPQGLHAKLT
jgi:hypothetical protein